MGSARLLCSALSILWIASAEAQVDSVAAVLPVIEVRAPRLDPRALLDRDTGFATLWTAEQWESGLSSSTSLLDQSLGVQVRSRGPLGASASLGVRGSSSQQVPVYLDGVLLNDPLRGSVDLGSIDLSSVERVEIHRSGAPLTLGASSLGGAIHLYSRRAATAPRLLVGSGRYGERLAEGSSGLTWHGLRLQAHLRVARSEGDWQVLDDKGTIYNAQDDEWVQRANNDARLHAILLQAALPWRGGELWLSEQYRDRDVGDPGVLHHESARVRFGEREHLLRAAYRRPAGRLHELSMHQRTALPFLDDPAAEYGLPSRRRDRLDEYGADLRTRWRRELDAVWVGVAAQRMRSRDQAQRDGEGEAQWRHSLSAAYEPRFESGAWRLEPGLLGSLHYERFHSTPATSVLPTGELHEAWRWTHVAQLGLRYRLSPQLFVKGNLARSERLPTMGELYGSRAGVLANANLNSETAWLGDLGLIFRPADEGRFELVLFENHYDDLIAFEPISPRAVKARNVASARSRGLEALADFGRIGMFRHSVQFEALFSEDQSEDPARNGTPLLGRPRYQLLTRAGITVAQFDFDYEVTAIGRSYFESGARSPLPSQLIQGLSARWRLGPASLYARLDNLTDAELLDVWRYPLPGRALRLALEYHGAQP